MEETEMSMGRHYDEEYRKQAVKLAQEMGQSGAAKELGIPKNTLCGWMRQMRLGNIDLGVGTKTPEEALTLNEEIQQLRKTLKEQNREIKRLKEENEFLEEASAFFAASRRKSAKSCE